MTYLGMYLLTKLDNFMCFFDKMAGLLSITFILLSIFTVLYSAFIAEDDLHRTYIEIFKEVYKVTRLHIFFISMLVLSLITTLIPTTKQAAFIWVAPQIIENGAVKDTVKNIPELTKLGTEYLKELLKERTNDIKR